MSAQFEIERSIAAMPVIARSETEKELTGLRQLVRRIGNASPADLSAMRAEIAAAVTTAQAVVQQGRAAATAETAAVLAEATLAARREVTELMRDLHHFDPYLRFSTPEDETAYRKREAERRVYIEAEQAKGSLQGDLNAINTAMAQLDDAGKHGASESPDFADRVARISGARNKVAAALGISPAPGAMSSQPSVERMPEQAASDLDAALAALVASGVKSGDLPASSQVRSGSAGRAPATLGQS